MRHKWKLDYSHFNTEKMKKLFYFLSVVCLLASCSKEQEPEPVVVTNDALTGTWVYNNTANGMTEILMFTKNGGFYYTTSLADAAFIGYPAGNYSISENVNLTTLGTEKSLDATVTKLSANSFTIRDNATNQTITYSKLVKTLQLAYLESGIPEYSVLVAGNVSSYKSHNEKIATVDKTGAITAVAEGITLIDVVASEGTAAVLVKAEGLIPDYAKAIGYTKDQVLAEYGKTIAVTNEMILYTENDKFITYNISKRTKKVEKITIHYSYKPFSNNDLITYLKSKYYTYKPETTPSFFAYTNAVSYEASYVKVTFDNATTLTYTYINHDLFEDFSIALGMTMDTVKYMYGEELTIIDGNDAMLEYEIGDEVLGYAGVKSMDGVTFYFSNGIVNQVNVKLVSSVKTADVNAFLSEKYIYDPDQSNNKRKIYHDYTKGMKIQYIVEENRVRYSN